MAPVKLYVYDLSNGLAKNISFQWTGKQIDGIWHTSVVVFGKEVYYGPYNAGPGIQVTDPGKSHHGQPLHVVDMGETALDEETFWEYITEIQNEYTGDKYHLLDFNCNSFTNDCVGFLTGGSIPSWIKDLPAEFLSTPFGRSMRPMIDNMYRRPLPAGGMPGGPQLPPLPTAASTTNAATLTSHVQMATNTSSFNNLLTSNKILVAFFTSDTCAPCKMIEPVFKNLAEETGGPNIAFAEVNLSSGMSQMIAQQYKVSATPTFLFFLNGQKVSELKGVNAPELKSQVNLLIFEAFPPHPHVKLDLPAIRSISLDPILFTTPPPFDALNAKLGGFIDSCSLPNKADIKAILSTSIIPALKRRFPAAASSDKATSLSSAFGQQFAQVTQALLGTLAPADVYPLVDLWRIAILDPSVSSWVAESTSRPDAISSDVTAMIFQYVQKHQTGDVPRTLLLTTLRLANNCFASDVLQRHILTPSVTSTSPTAPRALLTSILIPALLHEDSATRMAAASLAFNFGYSVQKPLMEKAKQRGPSRGSDGFDGDGEWEVEIVSALIEALQRETQKEDVVHRLVASLAFMIHLSPYMNDSISPLLDVLQARNILSSKLQSGGCGEKGVIKEEVRKLIKETASLCPEAGS